MSDKPLDPMALVSKFAEREKQLASGTFLAPVTANGAVRVRLDGIAYDMKVRNPVEGWAILRMTQPGKAEIIEQAPPTMIAKYLRLFPRVRLVLLEQFEERWWAIAASVAGTPITIEGPVPVQLMTALSSFDTIYSRFDGAVFWLETIDRRRDPRVARKLREALAKDTDPDDLRCPGIVPQERLAYSMLWLRRHKDERLAKDDRTRISEALSHAGATLDSFWTDRSGATAVRFVMDGRSHVVQIDRDTLGAISAGICLSGGDRAFDLTSLVGVLREAEGGRMYYD